MAALIFAAFLCLGWWWPDHFAPWLAFHNEALAFVALILGLGLTLWRRRDDEASYSAGFWLATALIGMALLQWLGGLLPYHGDAILALIYAGGAGLAWEMGRRWAAQPGRTPRGEIDTLAWAFVVGATLSALVAFIQWAEQESAWTPWVMSAAHTTRAIGNLAQPNQLSTLLSLGLVATALLYERGRVSGVLAVLLVSVQTLALVLTQSRTGMLIVLVLLALSLWVAPRSQRLRWRVVLVWALGFLLLTGVYQELGEQASKAALGTQKVLQVGLRPLMWQQFGAALSAEPWLGYGWLQTVRAQQEGALLVPGQEQVIYTHNQLLDLAVWLGLPATLLLLMAALSWVWRRRQGFDNVQARWGVIWLAPLGVHAMLEFPLAYAYFLFPAAVIAGMIDRWTEPAQAQRSGPGTAAAGHGSWILATMLAMYTALALAVALEYTRAEEDFRIVRFESRKLGQTPVDYAVPDFLLLDQLGVALRATRVNPQPGMPDEDMELLAGASARYPWLPTHFRYAVALGLNGKPAEAARQMSVIKGLYGNGAYAEVAENFRRLQQDKYPELGKVPLP